MLSAFGDNRLMPSPEVDCLLINASSGYARTNRSWPLNRLLRDRDHWIPRLLPISRGRAVEEKLEELHKLNTSKPVTQRRDPKSIRIGLRVTVWECLEGDGRGGHDAVYWSGVAVMIVQLLCLGLAPLLLYGEYFTMIMSGCGTALAWLSGALAQWEEEKFGVRRLDKMKDIFLTEGSGSHDIIMLRSAPGLLDLEALASPQRQLKHPRLTRISSAILAICWIALLITVAGWQYHTWYILGVGIVGIVHNVYVAASARTPKALGIPIRSKDMFLNDKVMKVLWELETAYPNAGASALASFLAGSLSDKERIAWAFATMRCDDWRRRNKPYRNQDKPDAWPMPTASWVDQDDPDLSIFKPPV